MAEGARILALIPLMGVFVADIALLRGLIIVRSILGRIIFMICRVNSVFARAVAVDEIRAIGKSDIGL